MCREEHAKAIDKAVFPGWQGGPMMHSIAAKAVAFKEAQSEDFRPTRSRSSPTPQRWPRRFDREGLRIVSGGTENHLMLVDLRSVDVTGKEAEARLDEVGITANKNAIPYDPEKPFIASGIRIGTPAITTCGMKEAEASEVARLIAVTLKDDSEATKNDVRAEGSRAHRAVPALSGRCVERPNERLPRRRFHRAGHHFPDDARGSLVRGEDGSHRPAQRQEGACETYPHARRPCPSVRADGWGSRRQDAPGNRVQHGVQRHPSRWGSWREPSSSLRLAPWTTSALSRPR